MTLIQKQRALPLPILWRKQAGERNFKKGKQQKQYKTNKEKSETKQKTTTLRLKSSTVNIKKQRQL